MFANIVLTLLLFVFVCVCQPGVFGVSVSAINPKKWESVVSAKVKKHLLCVLVRAGSDGTWCCSMRASQARSVVRRSTQCTWLESKGVPL